MFMWGVQGHRYAAQRLRPTGRLTRIWLCMCVVVLSGLLHVSADAIDVHPAAQQIQTALDQGKAAAQKGLPPDSFYVRFGVADEVNRRDF